MTEEELERLRRALDGDYRLEHEIAVRGAAVHFLARDLGLDRPVEVVALLPAADGGRPEAFLDVARRMARVNQPNVVAVHHARLSGGIVYLVREHLAGETLASRLLARPLRPREVVGLGRDLLQGIEALHAVGVVHPDLAPETIVCLAGRTVIAGSGGLPAEAGARARDLVAVGSLLYQAATGDRWDPESRGAAAWRGVPYRLRRVLRRALAGGPGERWRDAAAFRRALEGLDASRHRWSLIAATASAALVALAAGSWAAGKGVVGRERPGRPGGGPKELAVLPLEVAGGRRTDSLGIEVAQLLQMALDNVPGLELTSPRQVLRWWEDQGRDAGGAQAEAARFLNVHWVAHGLVRQRADTVWARLALYDAAGAKIPLPELRGSVQDFSALGDTLAINVLRAAAPDLEPLYRGVEDISGVPFLALKAFLRGEAAFEHDAWELAERSYEAAIDADSGFALAGWRLANVKRWRRLPYEFDLAGFYARSGSRLRPADRALVEAMLEPDVERRLARMEQAVRLAPSDAYTRFLYAEELFHRGPLVGRRPEAAARAMGEAIALDSSLAEAYNHLFMAQVRAGRGREARRLLDLRRRVSRGPSPGDADVIPLLELAYDERFRPWLGWLERKALEWRADSARLADVARVARLGGPWFDIPGTQVALGRILIGRGPAADSARASARTGVALGLMMLGRPEAAVAQLDSAVALFPSAEARLQQAEWRAIPQAVGVPPLASAADPGWDDRLERLAADSGTATRALWALALRRLAAGESAGFEVARARLDALDASAPLGALVRAAGEGARGRTEAALAILDSVRPLFAVSRPPDPFAGVVFHLLRAEWQSMAGDARGADREWRWYEGSDFEGWPAGVPQAGEIEAPFGVHARVRRGLALLAGARTPADSLAACALLARAGELWRSAEPAIVPLAAAARLRAEACRR